MRNEMIELGERVRRRRELLGLLQPELAALAGISTRTIQLVEQGKGNPSLETLICLIDSLGLQLSLQLKSPGKNEDV